MSEAEETTSTDYSDLPVQTILNKSGNTMYLKMGASIKIKDISDDDALWDDITALNGDVNDAVYADSTYYLALNDGSDVDLYYKAAIDKDTTLTDLDGQLLDDMNITNLFTDGTNAFAVFVDGGNIVVEGYNSGVQVGAKTTVVTATDNNAILNSFAIDDGTKTQLFINIFDHSDETNVTYHMTLSGGVLSAAQKITNPDFSEYLIGGVENNNVVYLYTNDGVVYKFDAVGLDFNEINTNETSIFADDETIAIGMNSSGNSIVRYSGVPTVLVTETDGTGDILALIAGDEYLFELNLTDAEEVGSTITDVSAVEVEAEAGNYFNALSSTRITDFYDASGTGDWAFYTATSSSFVLTTTEEEAVSTVIP